MFMMFDLVYIVFHYRGFLVFYYRGWGGYRTTVDLTQPQREENKNLYLSIYLSSSSLHLSIIIILYTSTYLSILILFTKILLSIYPHPFYKNLTIHLSIIIHHSLYISIYIYLYLFFLSITSTSPLSFYLSNIHCTSIHLSICTPILLSIYITYFVHLPFYIYLSILLKHLFFYPSNLTSSVHLSFYKSIYYHLYIYSFIHLSIISSVHLSFYIYLSIIIYIYTYSIYISYSIHLSLYDTLYSINLSL